MWIRSNYVIPEVYHEHLWLFSPSLREFPSHQPPLSAEQSDLKVHAYTHYLPAKDSMLSIKMAAWAKCDETKNKWPTPSLQRRGWWLAYNCDPLVLGPLLAMLSTPRPHTHTHTKGKSIKGGSYWLLTRMDKVRFEFIRERLPPDWLASFASSARIPSLNLGNSAHIRHWSQL